jgi:Glucodextranase, domain B
MKRVFAILAGLFLFCSAFAQAQSNRCCEIKELVLWNTDTNKAVRTLAANDVIDVARIPHFTIVATTNPSKVGSVVFGVNVVSDYKLENLVPYSISGDKSLRPLPWKQYPNGIVTVTATAYSMAQGKGTKGRALVRVLRIGRNVSQTPTPTVTATRSPTAVPSATRTTAPPTSTPTLTSTPTPTPTPTLSPSPTATGTMIPSSTPTAQPSSFPSPTSTPLPTAAPSSTPTLAPTATPTLSPTPEPTPTPTFTPTPVVSPTRTRTPGPFPAPTGLPPTPIPTNRATPTPGTPLACILRTCEDIVDACGVVSDGCGGTISCSFCPKVGPLTVNRSSVLTGSPTQVTATVILSGPVAKSDSVQLERIDDRGNIISVLGALGDEGTDADTVARDRIYTGKVTLYENSPTQVRVRASAIFKGSVERVNSETLTIPVSGSAVGFVIESPTGGTSVNISPITVRGRVINPTTQVKVNGVDAPINNLAFVASVPLNEGPNTLTAVATNENGSISTANVLVSLDTTRPQVTLYSPVDGAITTSESIEVSGLVNDIVVGTVNNSQVSVRINGADATVSNRSFTVSDIPINMGPNIIQAVATDIAGNQVTRSITVNREALSRPTIRLVSGNSQSGVIGTDLPNPFVVEVVNAQGEPVVNTPVVFRVIQQDGLVRPVGDAAPGIGSVSVTTSSEGRAAVAFTAGTRAGAGNNLVEVSSSGIQGTVMFSASGTPKGPKLLVVDSGNNQTGAVGSPLPFPLIAVVVDEGNNRIPSIPVTFSVTNGNGSFGSAKEVTTTSDSDGRVMAFLTLGPDEGANANLIQAKVQDSTSQVATFTATGLIPGPASETSISGVVLDNSNLPLEGVTLRLFNIIQGAAGNIPQQVGSPVQTNGQGQFLIKPAPVGVFKLMADGGTTTRSGDWPTLEFDMITVSGRDNTVGLPIYLPPLASQNRVCVGPTSGGTLTIPSVPGFSLAIAPGSATFPGGSRSGCVSVTPVHMDKVPMVPGFGQQPQFVVTIQPVGTHFNPPAALTLPNVDRLNPRKVTEMYSYDHDMASFVSIGTGTVSDDGSVVVSDNGVGVMKAGWHGGGGPTDTGSAGTCGECETAIIGGECLSKFPPGARDPCLYCYKNTVREVLSEIEGLKLICPSQAYTYKVQVEGDRSLLRWYGYVGPTGRVFIVPNAPEFEFEIEAALGECSRTKSIRVSDGLPGGPSEAVICLSRPIECFELYGQQQRASKWADDNEQALGFGIFGGCADAARHAFLSTLMNMQLGEEAAELFLDAHEQSNYNGCTDNNMDLMNNAVGAELAREAKRREITDGAPPCITRQCIEELVVAAMKDGRLTVFAGNRSESGELVPSSICQVGPLAL